VGTLILAAVLPASFWLGTVYLLTYIAGLATVLLLIALLGQRFIGNISWAADPNGWFKRSLGVIFLIVGIAIFSGLDKQFEALILDVGFNTVNFENGLLEGVL
jgi:cytochrome c-type biogenesis protein